MRERESWIGSSICILEKSPWTKKSKKSAKKPAKKPAKKGKKAKADTDSDSDSDYAAM